MKQRVYIETTIVSYLTAGPSRDVVLLGHQEITREWWNAQRKRYELCTSELVLNEASRGDAGAADKRLQALAGLPQVPTTDEAAALARDLLRSGMLPEQAGADALHLAIATVNDVDVLLTWNCRHLANGRILGQIGRFVRKMGYELPTVCTPDELMGEMDAAGD